MKQEILDIEGLISTYTELSHYNNDLICFERTSPDLPFPYQIAQLNPYFSITLIKQGRVDLRLNGADVTIAGESLLLHDMNYHVEILSCSKDVRMQTLYISNAMTQELPSLYEITNKICLQIRENQNYLYPLNQFNYELIAHHFQTIVNLMGSIHTYLHARLHAQMSALWLDVGNIMARSQTPTKPKNEQTRQSRLFKQFYNLVVSHCRQHHHVDFYADTLHVSRQYLSRIIKTQTHRAPHEYIADMLLVEARRMLMNRNNSVAQIADALSFEDTASFCKFFKRHTGTTPSAYRHEECV